MRVRFTADTVKGLEHAATPEKDQGRPVLCGVYVDPAGYLIATDSFALVAKRVKLEFETPEDAATFKGAIIPASASKMARGKYLPVIVDTEANTATIPAKSGAITVPLIEGTYPNWRVLMPHKDLDAPRVPQRFDPELLVKTAKALGLDSPSALQLWPGKDTQSPALYISEDALAIIMPMYGNHTAGDVKRLIKSHGFPVKEVSAESIIPAAIAA